MFGTILQRIFDPTIGGERRAATMFGASIGLLAGVGSLLAGAGFASLFFAIAAGFAVGLPAFFLFRGQRKMTDEMRDLWGLQALVTDGLPWPAPGGWALGAGALGFITEDIRRRDHNTVVELGPGVSSVVLGSAEPDLRMFGLEHDEGFVGRVRDLLRHHEIEDYGLIHAPLEKTDAGSTWYQRAALEGLPQEIDVLIVDGPPNWKGEGNRSSAWEMLGSRMQAGGLVLVDDTNRSDERRMVGEWLATGQLTLEYDAGDFMALRVAETA